MTDIMAGTMLMVIYSLVGFVLLVLCAWIVEKNYPEHQTTNQQLTIVYSGSATRRGNKSNKVA